MDTHELKPYYGALFFTSSVSKKSSFFKFLFDFLPLLTDYLEKDINFMIGSKVELE
ncbi:hypothetical protein Noda2021_05380 [Candidatus Dependentiae bacterium Noda2021]|nr:hypothetical protein Noda2021_05380 [Candidatus Dependentiae bacterium Noda2021]